MRYWMNRLIGFVLLLLIVGSVPLVNSASGYGTIEPLGTCMSALDTSNAESMHFKGTSSQWTGYTRSNLSENERNSFFAIEGKQIWDSVLYYEHADVPTDMSHNIVYAWHGMTLNGQSVFMEVWNFYANADLYFVFLMKPDYHGGSCGFYTISKADFWDAMKSYGCLRKRC